MIQSTAGETNDLSVADLIELVRHSDDLPKPTRKVTLVGLRQLCRILKKRPEEIPASADAIRDDIHGLYLEEVGYSPRTFTSIKSSFLRALRVAGLNDLPPTHSIRPGEDWAEILDPIDIQSQRMLSRFVRYCTALGISPKEVSDEDVIDFSARLNRGSLIKDPHHSVVKVCWAWNRLRCQWTHWPQIELTAPLKNTTQISLPWEALPAAFRSDVERFIARIESGIPLHRRDKRRRRSPLTIEHYQRNLRNIASLALRSGLERSSLQSLEDLVRPKTVIAAFDHYHQLSGDAAKPHMSRMMMQVRFVARHWVHVDDAALTELDQLHTRVGRIQPQLTPRSRAVLGELDNPQKLLALMALPDVLLKRAETGAGPRRPWVSAQAAAAIAIMLSAPISARRLRHLHRSEHLERAEDGTYIVTAPERLDARGRPMRYNISKSATQCLDAYLERFFPHGDEVPWVFANRYGDVKSGAMLSLQIRREVRILTGIDLSTRDFGHLAAKIYLDHNPGQFEVVRRLLGQKNISSTLAYYKELSSVLSPTVLDEIVLQERPKLAAS